MFRWPMKPADRFCRRTITSRRRAKKTPRRIPPGSFRAGYPDAPALASIRLLDECHSANCQPLLAGLPVRHQFLQVGFEFRQPAVEIGTQSHEFASLPDTLDRLLEDIDFGM